MKKVLLISTALGLIANASWALAADTKTGSHNVTSDEMAIKLSGYAHFQAGYRDQKHLSASEKNVSTNHSSAAFYNQVALVANPFNKVNDVEYGAKIILVPTASPKGGPTYNGSHIYIESDFGKIELGAPFVAASSMMIDGSAIAAGTFEDWSRYANISTDYLKQGTNLSPSFTRFPEFFLDSKLLTDLKTRPYSSEPPRSVAYYTPTFDIADSGTKWRLGLSYTPDTSNTGADSPSTHGSGLATKTIDRDGVYKFTMDHSLKNVVSAGLTLEHEISEDIDFQFALTGTQGKSVGKAKKYSKKEDKEAAASYDLKNLKEYNIGAVLNLGNFSVATGYGNLGNSLTTKEFYKNGTKTDYYSGTVAYKQAGISVSLSYFKGKQFGNVTDAFILATSYKLAPGLSPYIELAKYSLKGKPEYYPALQKKKTSGLAVITGLKLSF